MEENSPMHLQSVYLGMRHFQITLRELQAQQISAVGWKYLQV